MPDLIYNVKFNIDSSETEKISAPIDGSSMAEVEQLKQEIEELKGRNDELVNSLTTLEETMNRVGNSSGKAAGRVGNVGNQSRKTGKRIGDLNKQTAAFNQTIFAFGDLAQDTIQFQYGIATGMRAIGNNIGFAAELFANAALNVRRYNEAVESGAMGTAQKTTVIQAFVKSLFGVGGLILAVNAATTVFTFLTARMEKSRKEMEASIDTVNQYANAIAGLSMFSFEDILGTERLRKQIDNLNTLFSDEFQTPVVVAASKLKEDIKVYNEISADFLEAVTGETDKVAAMLEYQQSGFAKQISNAILEMGVDARRGLVHIFTDADLRNFERRMVEINVELGRTMEMFSTAKTFVRYSTLTPEQKQELAQSINAAMSFANDQEKVVDFMVDTIRNYEGFAEMFVRDFKGTTDSMTDAIDAYRELQERGVSGEELVESIKEMNKELAVQDFLLASSPLGRYVRDTSLAAETLMQFNQAGAKNEEQIRDMIKALKLERTAQLSLAQSTVASNEAKEEAIGFIRFLNKLIPQLEGALDDTTESTKDFSDELFDVSTRIRRAVFEASQFETISRFGDASGEAAKLIFGQAEALESLAREIEAAKQESPQLVSRLQRLMDVVDVRNQQQVLEFAKSLSEVFDSDGTEVDRLTKQYEENRNALELLIDSASGLRETSGAAIDDSSLLFYKQSIESVTEQLDKLEQKKLSGDPLSDIDLSTYDALKLRLQSLKQSYDSLQERVDVQIDVQTDVAPINVDAQIDELSRLSPVSVPVDVEPIDVSSQKRALQELQKLSDVDAQSLIPYYSQEAVALAGLSQEITSYKSELYELQRVQQSGQALTDEQVLRADALSTAISMTQAQYDEQSQALQKSIDATQDSIGVTSQLEQMLRNLEQGYEDAKQAIEDKTRAEYADLIASEHALNQYGKAYQQAVMFVREHEAALVGLSPELQALEGQYASLAAQNLVQSLIGQFDTGEDPMDKLNRQLADTRASLDLLKDKGLIDQGQLDAALLALEGVGLQQKELIANQEVLNNLQAAMSMAQAIGQLGEVFEASKQFQYAVALTSGALGIVLALSDSTQKSTLARFALAASVAAATAVQIKQIADTNIGSTGNVQEPSAGSYFGSGSGFTSVAPPTQQISFAPTNSTSGGDTVVNNQVLVDSRGLAIQTKIGERQVKNSQKTVQPEP